MTRDRAAAAALLAGVLLATGVASGLAGAVLTLLLRGVQHAAYGYRSGPFEAGVEAAAPGRRVAATAVAGVLAGGGWWALRSGRGVGPGAEAVARGAGPLHPLRRSLDAALQIVVVGLGAALGREGAPRQLAAVAGDALARRARLADADLRLVVACAAGAGLAAVYDVPVAGVLFVAEAVLASARPRVLAAAVLACVPATVVAWVAVPRGPLYRVGFPPVSATLVVGGLAVGVVAGAAGTAFAAAAARATAHRPVGARLSLATVPVLTALGVAAVWLPPLLGNGRGPATLAFLADRPVAVLALLALARPVATVACLGAGVGGGLITPALATGALVGGVTGTGWAQLWPGAPAGGYAVLGAAALLGVTQRAPLTALVLTVELTAAPPAFWAPAALAVAAGWAGARAVRSAGRRRPRRRPGGPPRRGSR